MVAQNVCAYVHRTHAQSVKLKQVEVDAENFTMSSSQKLVWYGTF